MPYLITDSKDRDEIQFLADIQPNLELWTFEEEEAIPYVRRSDALKTISRLQELGYSDHVSPVFWEDGEDESEDD